MALYTCVDKVNKSETRFWQPRRSNMTSYLKSVTPIIYLSICILLKWHGPFWQPRRPPQPPNSLRGQIWPQIWNQWPQLPTDPCAYCWYSMGPLGSLWGHYYSLQTASEVKSDLRFEISDPNYILIHVHIAYMVWALLAASEATTASKQPQRSNLTSNLK